MYFYLNLFFIVSILGFIIEQSTMILFNNHFNSGILHGPWTPVYGFASLLIIKVGDTISKYKISKFKKTILFIIINFILLTIIEYITGSLIEKCLNIVYWDYSNLPFHIGKYSCFYVSLIWVIYSFILYFIIYPFLKNIIKRIPHIITILAYFIFIIDIIYTLIETLTY